MTPLKTTGQTENTDNAEIPAIVHEELDRLPDRQRLPLILCDLEGLTYDQAARHLRWTEPTLRHRLAKARLRLRDRLIRRGVTAGAVGVVLGGSMAGARAAVPAALARATAAAATGGASSATAAALTTIIIRSMLMTRLKIASIGILAATTLASGRICLGRSPGVRRTQARTEAARCHRYSHLRRAKSAPRCDTGAPCAGRGRPGHRGSDRRPGGPADRRRPGRGHEPLVGPG